MFPWVANICVRVARLCCPIKYVHTSLCVSPLFLVNMAVSRLRRRQILKALLISMLFLTQRRICVPRRRYYVRRLNTFRRSRGEYHCLVRDIRRFRDSETFHRIFRMNTTRFDTLLQKVKPFLEKEGTHALPIGPAERLSFTLNVLASGMTITRAAISYRIGKSTGCTIF